ncbi:hypothetical protein LJK88_17230 [Paenibacillus sp. P26]|nr:hypothetical protein LJK88_17230 [Paenibacillus sp. P26]
MQQADPKPAEQPEPKPAAAVPADPKPAPAPQKEEVSAKGKKSLLAGRENAPEDAFVAERLKALGFNVTMMIDREFKAAETKGYDLIYISQTMNSKFLKDGVMKDVAIPTVYVKNHGMFYLGLSSIEDGASVANIKSIAIKDPAHKVAEGFSGTVDVYKETNSKIGISYGLPGKEAKIIATIPGTRRRRPFIITIKARRPITGMLSKRGYRSST